MNSSMDAHRRAVKEKCSCPWCGKQFKSKTKFKKHINDDHRDPVNHSKTQTATANARQALASTADKSTSRSHERSQRKPIQFRWKPDLELIKYRYDDYTTVLAWFGDAYYRLAYPKAPLGPTLQRTLRPTWLPLWAEPAKDMLYFYGYGGFSLARPHDHDPEMVLQAFLNDGAVIIDDPNDEQLLNTYDPRLDSVPAASRAKHQETFVDHAGQQYQQPQHQQRARKTHVNQAPPQPIAQAPGQPIALLQPYARWERQQSSQWDRDRNRNPHGARRRRDPTIYPPTRPPRPVAPTSAYKRAHQTLGSIVRQESNPDEWSDDAQDLLSQSSDGPIDSSDEWSDDGRDPLPQAHDGLADSSDEWSEDEDAQRQEEEIVQSDDGRSDPSDEWSGEEDAPYQEEIVQRDYGLASEQEVDGDSDRDSVSDDCLQGSDSIDHSDDVGDHDDGYGDDYGDDYDDDCGYSDDGDF